MDHRDVAAKVRPLFARIEGFNGYLREEVLENLEPEGDEVAVRIKYEVCTTCDGKGTHVNPSIDAHGISREEFDEDPDFEESYFAGRYDVPCNECGGNRVVPTIDETHNPPDLVKQLNDWLAEEWAYARERTHELEMGY